MDRPEKTRERKSIHVSDGVRLIALETDDKRATFVGFFVETRGGQSPIVNPPQLHPVPISFMRVSEMEPLAELLKAVAETGARWGRHEAMWGDGGY